jgi:hypothetical protein
MVGAPPAAFTAVRVLTPQGWVLVQPDATIQIDLTAFPPVMRAVIPAPLADYVDVFVVGPVPVQSYPLAVVPAVGTLQVYRNGLLMAAGYDYTLDGVSLSFVDGQPIVAGDILQFRYRR